MISPFTVTSFFSILIWYYLRSSFKRNFITTNNFKKSSIYILDTILFILICSRFIFRLYPHLHKNQSFLVGINLSFVLLGFVGLLAFILIFIDVLHLLNRFVPEENKTPELNQRREFLKKTITLGGLGSSVAVTGFGYANSFNPTLTHTKVNLPEQFKNLSGLKIIQLSDIHIGPTLKKDFAQMLVTRTNEQNPDLVFITGDLIDGTVDEIGEDVLPLKDIKAKLGVYYITGNHEYYWNANAWIKFVNEKLQIKTLLNENEILKFNNSEFAVCGVTDLHSSKFDERNAPDYKKARANLSEDIYKILLAHQPKACYDSVKHGYHFQLSGHTHGGQGFPWNIIVYLVQPYIKGLYKHEGMDLYVHKGCGFWGPPNRFMVDSEIALIELV